MQDKPNNSGLRQTKILTKARWF